MKVRILQTIFLEVTSHTIHKIDVGKISGRSFQCIIFPQLREEGPKKDFSKCHAPGTSEYSFNTLNQFQTVFIN